MCTFFCCLEKNTEIRVKKKKELQTAADKGNFGFKAAWLINICLDKSYFGRKN